MGISKESFHLWHQDIYLAKLNVGNQNKLLVHEYVAILLNYTRKQESCRQNRYRSREVVCGGNRIISQTNIYLEILKLTVMLSL